MPTLIFSTPGSPKDMRVVSCWTKQQHLAKLETKLKNVYDSYHTKRHNTKNHQNEVRWIGHQLLEDKKRKLPSPKLRRKNYIFSQGLKFFTEPTKKSKQTDGSTKLQKASAGWFETKIEKTISKFQNTNNYSPAFSPILGWPRRSKNHWRGYHERERHAPTKINRHKLKTNCNYKTMSERHRETIRIRR